MLFKSFVRVAGERLLLGLILAGLGALLPACTRQVEEPPIERTAAPQADGQPSVRRQALRQAPTPVSPVLPEPEGDDASSSTPSKLPLYELTIDHSKLRSMEMSAFSNDTVPGTFTCNGEAYEVQVRYRGAWARTWPKKPLKVFFAKEKPFREQRCLNLNSGWHDPAMVREVLAYHVYEVAGAPGSRARMVRVHVNGRFRGVYVEVEQPDQAFLRARHLKGAAVYKAVSRARQADERDLGNEAAYAGHYEKQTKKSESYGDLQQFCRALAQAQEPVEFFERNVDLERYIDYLAATVLVQNWDGFNKNHFLVHDNEGSGKWFVLPWDLDRTFGDHWNWSFAEARLSPFLGVRTQPGVTGWNRLQDRFFSHPTLRGRFLDRLSELLEKEFTPARLFPVVDKLYAEVAADAALDRKRWPSQDNDVRAAIEQVKQYIEERRAFLLSEIPKLRGR